MMKTMLNKQHKFWQKIGHILRPAGIVKLQMRGFGPSNTSDSSNETARHKQTKQLTLSMISFYQSRTTQRGSSQDYNRHLRNSWIIAHIGIWDAGNMRMKHGKNTSSYANTMKYAKHVDETMKITTKHYKKLLNNNHHQTIMWKVSITNTHHGLHATVNIAWHTTTKRPWQAIDYWSQRNSVTPIHVGTQNAHAKDTNNTQCTSVCIGQHAMKMIVWHMINCIFWSHEGYNNQTGEQIFQWHNKDYIWSLKHASSVNQSKWWLT